MNTPYIGRFAPSPTGPLHFGSLVAALGSHVDARAQGGRWLVRIDDIDPAREVPGAADDILRTLEAHGLHWDGEVIYQSRRDTAYAGALARLEADGRVYRCTCSRRQIAAIARRGPLGSVYPGTCRQREHPGHLPAALRLALAGDTLAIEDAVQGRYDAHAATDFGDVIIRRRTGDWAYHLATAVDDAALGVTDVVRGADLLPCSLVQQALQEALDFAPVRWCHLPVARNAAGVKLSKQTGARALDRGDAIAALLRAWAVLGQAPPPERPPTVTAFLDYAVSVWQRGTIPQTAPAGAQASQETVP